MHTWAASPMDGLSRRLTFAQATDRKQEVRVTQIQNAGNQETLPAVSVPTFESSREAGSICVRKKTGGTRNLQFRMPRRKLRRFPTPVSTHATGARSGPLHAMGPLAQPFGRRVQITVISPVTAPSPRRISMATGNSGRSPASSCATTSAAGRPSVAVAVTAPMASFL